MHATLRFWPSAYSLKGHEQNGPLILTVPGRERCFRSNASHQPQKRVSACDPVIDEDPNGALWKRKAREEMPPISQPLFSNKCRTKWLLNAIEALPRWVWVCVCLCLQLCNCVCRCTCFHPWMYACVHVHCYCRQHAHVYMRVCAWLCMWGDETGSQ